MRAALSTSAFVLATWLWAGPAAAQPCTHYVAPSGSAGWPSCTASAPCSLSAANANAAAGEVVCLQSGVYAMGAGQTAIRPTQSGTDEDHRLVFQAAPGAVPVLTHADDDDANYCIELSRVSYVTVRGITCRGSESGREWTSFHTEKGAHLVGSSHCVIEDNVFQHIERKGVEIRGHFNDFVSYLPGDYNRVSGNRVSSIGCHTDLDDTCEGTFGDGILLGWGASKNLVHGNVVNDVGHNGISLSNNVLDYESNFNVIQQNLVENPYHSQIYLTETVDPVNYPNRKAIDNVVQDNVVLLGATRPNLELTASNESGVLLTSPRNIVRRNRIVGNAAGVAIVPYEAGGRMNVQETKVYHNEISGSWFPGVRVRPSNQANVVFHDISFVNNAIVANGAASSGVSGLPDPTVQIHLQRNLGGVSDYEGLEFRNNLILEATPGQAVLEIVGDANCDVLAEAESETGDCTGLGALGVTFDGNVESGSLVDAGAYLTTTTLACGTAFGWIPVADPRFFSAGIDDGSESDPGAAYVSGDRVRIEGSTTVYRVTGFTEFAGYHMLIVTPEPGCAAGKGVSLAWSGAKPDIGAAADQ